MARRTRVPQTSPLARLDAFARGVDELLRARRLARAGLTASLSISFTKDALAVTATDPDEDDLIAYLTTLRILLTEADLISKLAARQTSDGTLRDRLRESRRTWHDEQRSRDVVLAPEEGHAGFTRAEIFDLYMNGRVVHHDGEMVALLDQLEAGPIGPMVRFMVQDHIVEATRYVDWLASAIRDAKERGVLSATPGV